MLHRIAWGQGIDGGVLLAASVPSCTHCGFDVASPCHKMKFHVAAHLTLS